MANTNNGGQGNGMLEERMYMMNEQLNESRQIIEQKDQMLR